MTLQIILIKFYFKEIVLFGLNLFYAVAIYMHTGLDPASADPLYMKVPRTLLNYFLMWSVDE